MVHDGNTKIIIARAIHIQHSEKEREKEKIEGKV